VTLADSSAEIQASSSVATGGQLSAGGRVALQAPFVTDVELQLGNVRITDLQLYETNVNGALRLSGSIPANLSVVGRLVLDRTEIRVPSTGIGAFGEIPKIVHLNESAAVRRTRSYAGLLDIGSAAGFGGGAAIGLDVQIAAENRIFVRGRGLDAELGGQLRLTGTTADVVPQGQFGLIRGRLDILGKRMTLEEGSAQLQGDLIPTLRLVARTTNDDTVLFVIVEGPADAPEIRFVSEPELPEDEVLARLLFGRDVTSISALQAVQLASAVATLAGRGGIGIVARLRQITGFDDLDLTTDAEGGTSLRVGKYISENAYSDVEIDIEGQSRVNLNLELTPSTKLRGQVGSDGSTGIGLFFERDY
jgi:translocation and assembly module TamB